jgi:VanZ family protein
MTSARWAFRVLAWLLLAAITFVTLGSAQYRPQTTLNHDSEHALAFVLLGIAFGLGYSRRRLAMAAAAVPVIGLIEILQLWAPGRHARLEDFAVNLLTFWAAFAAAGLAARILNLAFQPINSGNN